LHVEKIQVYRIVF